MGTGRALVYICVGLFGLMSGGQLIVSGAVSLARFLGVSEAVIGLSVVAVGTSLPELATSVIAARRGNADIAVGNVVGSNIFNVLFVLGISAVIQPLPFGRPVIWTLAPPLWPHCSCSCSCSRAGGMPSTVWKR